MAALGKIAEQRPYEVEGIAFVGRHVVRISGPSPCGWWHRPAPRSPHSRRSIGCTTIASIHYADDDPSGYLGLVRTSVNVYEVPFQYSPMNSAIIVNLKLNGSTSYPFIFDTGAGQCVIDWGMVEKLALRSLVQDAPVTDAGGAWRKMRLYSAVSVKLSIGQKET